MNINTWKIFFLIPICRDFPPTLRVRGKQAFERGVASCIQREVDLDARRRYEM